MAHTFSAVRHAYTWRDSALYALGLGMGSDPVDEAELPFVYEHRGNQKAMPSQVVVLARFPGWSMLNLGLDTVRIVHGEQSFRILRPIAPEGEIECRHRISQVIDKGLGKGALLYLETTITDARSGETVAISNSVTFARGDGGCGGPGGKPNDPHPIPERAPDAVVEYETLPQQALIYRLSGDYNPLHADPAVATKAGFGRPILHGLCTFGMAARAILKSFCDFDPSRLTAMQARFSAPVLPGEALRFELWREGSLVSFRARAKGRDAVVLNHGKAELGTC